jgi:hypothetical protein
MEATVKLTRANGMQKLCDYDAITLAENFASNSLLGTSLQARSPRKCLAATKDGLHEDVWSTLLELRFCRLPRRATSRHLQLAQTRSYTSRV